MEGFVCKRLPLLPLLLWLPCCPCCLVALLPWLPCRHGFHGSHGCLVALVALVALLPWVPCCLQSTTKLLRHLFFNRVISEKRIRTPPLSPPFKVGVFAVFYRQLGQGHNIARRGWERKAIFPPFEVNKT